ncbi:hypothetical protein UFOVP231_72 [uncultured Caudovirales phage]|uniref:HTH_XRE domain containing protein n=1 Tax=uncultured Caudovirales phage TaxID=2100421 RepID=A0A6J7WQ61_9CAUD|nr:hypothetical protein UFOVP231_72 [uncultured Caudovirales phage]
MQTKKSIEFRRLIEKVGLRRIDIVRYLGIGERTLYAWQSGHRVVSKSAMIAMYALAREPLPEKYLDDTI